MGPILSRIAAALAAGVVSLLTGLLVKAGLTVSPELAAAIGDFANGAANLLTTIATLASYGVAHKLFGRKGAA